MNSSQYIILIFIALLVCFLLNNYYNSENYTVFSSLDSVYSPIGVYGLNNYIKTIPITQYANQIAYDLQNPFPSSTTGVNRNNNIPWNPVSYRDLQEPDGQFVGIFSNN